MLAHPGLEVAHDRLRRALKLDAHDGQERIAQRRRRPEGDSPLDDAGGAEPAHALEASRRRQADLVRQRLVGDPAVALQNPKNAPVDCVERQIGQTGRLSDSQVNTVLRPLDFLRTAT